MALLRAVLRLLSRESVQVAAWIGLGGVALMGANLVLAAVLAADDFGRLTLALALLSVGVGMGPLGFMDLIVRREIQPEWGSMLVMSALTLLPAFFLGAVAHLVYGLGVPAWALITFGCAGGAIGLLSASFDRAEVRLNRAQVVSQLPFLFFAAGAALLFMLGGRGWLQALSLLVGGHVLSAGVGLVVFGRRRGRERGRLRDAVARWRTVWRNSATFLGIGVSTLLLSQVERFIIPRVLRLEDLALFGVVGTLVLGPYKLLQGGIGYALMPRLHASDRADERRTLVRHEIRFALGTSAALGAAVLVLVPYGTELLYAEKYPVGVPLVAVVAFIGTLRAVHAVLGAIVKALGNQTQLGHYHLLGWFSIGIAFAAAYLLARYGLLGVTLGVAVAWLARAYVGGLISRRAIEMPRVGDSERSETSASATQV